MQNEATTTERGKEHELGELQVWGERATGRGGGAGVGVGS